MAQTKVSALTELTTTDGAEELLVNDGGTSKKVTIANLLHDESIDSDHYVDGSIDNAHIADDAIDSEHYAAGSIDNEHIADNAIDSEHYAAGSIDNEHLADDAVDTDEIADNAVTLAKMAGGTDGNIISYDASGDPVAIATGTDGQVLTSTGAGSPPAFEDAASSFDPDGAVTINDTGADVDFRVESDTVTHALFVQGSDGNVGMGDSDPSEAKLSIDNVAAGDVGLQIVQAQDEYGLSIDQNGNNDALFIDTEATTTNGLKIMADALTTGKAAYFYSNSATTDTRNLVHIHNDHASATGTTALKVIQDSTGLAADFSGTGGIRSAGGILFGTDTAAANTLDDYEEGTFTMTASGSTGSAGTYAGSTTGRYVKIGSFVWFSVDFNITNRGSWTGYMFFNGLPFTADSAVGHHPVGINSYKTTKRNHGAYVKLSSTSIQAREEDEYGEAPISWDDLAGSVTDVFGFHGFYKV